MNHSHAHPADLQNVRHAIDTMDLGPIRFKLMDKTDGAGWPPALVDKTEVWYRRFLFLNAKLRGSGRAVVPNKLIDTFWHYHILDTQKYAEDCEKTFGYFLHHFPYFGMRGAADAAELNVAFADTLTLFQTEFGEAPDSASPEVGTVIGKGWTDSEELEGVVAGSEVSHCATACTSPCDPISSELGAIRPRA